MALELLEGSQKVGPLADLLIWRAELEARTGSLELALEWWAQARELCEPREIPLRHALSSTLEASALARAGHAEAARDAARRAAATLAPLKLEPSSPSHLRLSALGLT